MKDKMNYLTSGISWMLTFIETNEAFQLIMLILSAISTAITIAYTIYKWYNNAKKDNRITKEEIEDLGENLREVLKDKENKK